MNKICCSIVLYHHKPNLIEPLIQSILICSLCERLFLIDNSSTNELSILGNDSRIEYIFNNKNVGYGAGHNIAIKKSMDIAKYHVVINPDISFTDGTLEELYGYLEQHPEIGHVMPKIIYPDGCVQFVCKLVPSPFDLIFRRFLPSALFKNQKERFELRHSGYDKIMEVPYLSGCFMYLRLEALQQVGLFDERYFMYPEDIDLSRRIHQSFKTIFYPYAEVVHGYERGSYKNLKLFYIHITNIIKYFNKWGWFFDNERRRINRKTLEQFNKL